MSTPSRSHEHVARLDASIAFLNTLENCTSPAHAGLHATHELLDTVPNAVAFFIEHGIAHPESLAESAGATSDAQERWLARLRDVRSAYREVFDAEASERAASPGAVDTVNAVLRHRPLVELTPGSDGCGVGHRHTGDPTDEALARLAEPLVNAIAGANSDRFRICANDACRWAFVDESRTGKRRWCDMATCGNRAKVARHRAKAKSAAAEPPIQLIGA